MRRDGTYLEFLAPEGYQSIVPLEQMIGRTVSEVMPALFADEVMGVIEQVLATGMPVVHEDSIVSLVHGGPPRYFEAKYVPAGENEVLSFVRETTTHRRTEVVLRANEERFRSLVESAADPFYAVNRKWELLYVNQRSCDALGYTRDELLAMTVWDFTLNFDPAEFASSFKGPGTPVTLQGRHKRKDGTMFPVEVRVSSAILDGEPCRFAQARDVTERNRAAASLQEAHDLLEERVEQRTADLDGANRTLEQELAERQRAQKALADDNALRRAIEDSAGAGITGLDPTGQVIYANRAFCEMTGIPEEEVIGSRPPFSWWPPEAHESMAASMRDLIAGELSTNVKEVQLRRRDGEVIDVLVQPSPLMGPDDRPLGWMTSYSDITAHKGRESELKSSQERLARTLALTPEAVVSVDEQQCVTLFNLWAEEVFGYSAAEVLGQHLSILLPEGAKEVHGDHISRFGGEAAHSRSMGQRSEISGLRKGGTEFPAEASIMKLALNGETVYTVMLRDITARKHAERELLEANRRLSETLDALQHTQEQVIQQERLRALGTMASGIAHDFNNKLVPILAYSDLLLNSPDMLRDLDTVKPILESVRQAAIEGRDVVGRLREFYRVHDDQEFALLDISDLVIHVLGLTEPKWKGQAQAEGVTIEVVTDLRGPLFVSGDETGLREMLTNLIFNAVDAMPSGGTLTVSTGQEAKEVVIEVADTGVGMTDAVRGCAALSLSSPRRVRRARAWDLRWSTVSCSATMARWTSGARWARAQPLS